MRTAVRYGIALLATAIALLLTASMPELLAPMRLFFLWCAVLTTAVVAGLGPAIFAIVLSVAGAAFLIFEPIGSLAVRGPVDVLRAVMFAAFAGGISVVASLRNRAEERALVSERDRRKLEEQALFINRASSILASSLAVEEIMQNLARLCVPAVADSCTIDLGADETFQRLVMVPPDSADVLREAVANVLQSGNAELHDHAAIVPMKARGQVVGAISFAGKDGRRFTKKDLPLFEELARRAATALDNARLYEAAESANRAKDEFLATLSHELRTPLTAINGWAHILHLGTDEKTARLAVETIRRSAKAQGELIDDLLDLSLIVAGKLHLNVTTVDLGKLAEEVVMAARPAADAKGLQVEVAGGPHPLLVRGDERRLRQVLWNLVSNAVKFTDPGGSIRIVLAARGKVARVDVIDTGRGIDAAFLPYVWDRFRQADSSTSRQHGGLGLGLAVVRHLVELHGGTVEVQSAGAGMGSTFSFELPQAALAVSAATG
jgi:signal transduction histidine kinase